MPPLGFIGAGNMAEAIIAGIIQKHMFAPGDIVAFDIDPKRMEAMAGRFGISTAPHLEDVALSADTIILAVKPGTVQAVVRPIKDLLQGKLLISIAAGVSIASIQALTNSEARVIRVMPNTPALVMEGVSCLACSPTCLEKDRELALRIFQGIGICLELDERLINAVTGLSGSGPAYGFLFIEALADGGVRAGLPRDVALKLAAATVKGAAALVLSTGRHPGDLKDMVASPGGTTIEGLAVLESRGFRSAVMDAVFAAYQKAAGLGK
ncbi:MAG: pyrroline-5-carboxylate reductase [Syntrophaceae bacterium]